MFKMRYFVTCLAITGVGLAIAAGSARAAEPENEQDLIAVLKSDAPKADKAITCKKLAVFGSADAVPALAALLPDAELTSWARIALEAIPDEAAKAALRDAMKTVDGRTLIGVINSVGVKRDAAAVPALVEKMGDSDDGVASAAAVALGCIGDAEATEALESALAGAPAGVRSAVAEGCILCAEKLLAAGKADDAAKLYDKVRSTELPKQRILEAIRGSILARGAEGVPLLIEQLASADKRKVNLGLQVARELPGDDVSKRLVAGLEQVPAERRSLVIVALSDRGDKAVLPAMLGAIGEGPAAVRIAAIGALTRLGDVTCVPALLEAACDDDEDVAAAAVAALAALKGDGVDADLASRLAEADGAVRTVLIDLAGRRRIEAAVPALLKAADDTDVAVRTAALTALGQTAGLENVGLLIDRVVAPKTAEGAQAAAAALKAACVRMADREACAAKLAAAIGKAPLPAKITILETLGAMGGPGALKALETAAMDKDPELQDAATRLLGEWMTIDAAPVLLKLADGPLEEKYQIRAMRGYIRIIRQFDVGESQRAEMCRTALQAAKRDAEKKLVLEVLARYPSLDTLRIAVEAAKIPALKDDAKATAMSIAQQIGGSADAQKLLTQVGHEPMKIEIVKAEYGSGTTMKDVTDVLQKRAGSFPLIVLPDSSYNKAFGGDPTPGVVKQLKIQYRIDGKPGEVTLGEDAAIVLPVPK